MGMPLETYSSVRKSIKENQDCTSGDYLDWTMMHSHPVDVSPVGPSLMDEGA